jgi:hypothetical protein
MNDADQPQIIKGLYQLHIDGGKKASAAGEKGLGAYGFVYATHAARSCRAGQRET